MENKNIKTSCMICNSLKIQSVFYYDMPIFMGTDDEITNEKDIIDSMQFDYCSKCGNVQIKTEILPSLLYKSNHNIGIIGNIWQKHYDLFCDFFQKDIQEKTIIEISDPSAKLAKMSYGFSSWTIVEPNPNFIESENIKLINTFFDKNFTNDKLYDVVIHSHFMEHCFSVHDFLKKCHGILNDNGLMIFSVPNLNALLNTCKIPNNILHFEHSYFFNEDTIAYLLAINGFCIEEMKKYKNHSIFYKCRKTKIERSTVPKHGKNIINKFYDLHEKSLTKVKNINKKIVNKPDVYLFGAHVNSQYYIYSGLDKISGIIDNSIWKQGKRLYGTNYKVYSPDVIADKKNPVVICSSLGPYKNEIKKQLRNINKTVVIL